MEPKSNSPLQKFLKWYATLPTSHRLDIAYFTSASFPGHAFDGCDQTDAEILVQGFIGWIDKYSCDRIKGVGLSLFIRTAISFNLTDRRWNRAEWNNPEACLTRAQDWATAEGHESMAAHAEEWRLEIPFKAKQWEKTSKEWFEFCNGPFSDENLNRWEGDMISDTDKNTDN